MSPGLELPTPGALHLWITRDQQIVDETALRRYAAWISPQEAERMNRFVFAKHRHQYLVARALVRSTLSLYAADVSPADWRFSVNSWGKPSISGPSSSLAFNLSHTDGLVALAVSSGSEVGVDVEHYERSIDLDVAKRFFAPLEVERLFRLPTAEQRRRFFDLWTLKESYIKACGQGLSIALDSFSFDFPKVDRIDFVRDHDRAENTGPWWFSQFELGGYVLALCRRPPPANGEQPSILAFEATPAGRRAALEIPFKRVSAAPGDRVGETRPGTPHGGSATRRADGAGAENETIAPAGDPPGRE